MNVRRARAFAVALLAALVPVPPAGAGDEERVLVFAAASMTSAVGDIADACESDRLFPIATSFAASSVLAKQIEGGASADIFLSANTAWMDYLDERGLLAADGRHRFAGNTLAMIAPTASPPVAATTPADVLATLPADDRIAMGDPDVTPAGAYAKAALVHYGLWDDVEGQVAGASTVRGALALVETGAVPFGIVYGTDAEISDRVRVVARFPAESHPPIVYEISLIADRDTPAVRQVFDCMLGADGAGVLQRHGFTTVEAGIL